MQINKDEIYAELDNLIEDGKAIQKRKWLHRNGVTYVDPGMFQSWHTKILVLIKDIIPIASQHVQNIEKHSENRFSHADNCTRSLANIKEYLVKGLIPFPPQATSDLESHAGNNIIKKNHIEETLVEIEGIKSSVENRGIEMGESTKTIQTNKVFIVHGHDEEAKLKVELFIRKLSLEPIVLSDKANEGKTIIEKLEKYTDVDFGIVLYTPCDKTTEGKSRARQNVILEHGFLMSKLGRSRVCALMKGDVEKPSDIDGIVYISMDNNNWEFDVVRELKGAGYEADANNL